MENEKDTYLPRNANGFNSLASSLLPLIRRVIGKRGMIIADLIALWGQIVGDEIATYTCPEKVDFARGERNNGVLKLKVSGGAFALEVKHREKFIIEKINAYFGYNAVSSIKIVQDANFARKSIAASNQPSPQKILVSEEEQNYIMKITEGIADDGLRKRLSDLGMRVFNRNHK